MDYYQVLGVSRSATKDEIRKAFKKIARENHPDAKPDDDAAAKRFKDAAEAYDVLGDEEKRKKYDQFGEHWKHAQGGAGPQQGNPFRSGGPVDVDLRDIFGGGGAVDLESLFGGMFGGGGARSRHSAQPMKGQDVTTSIQVPFQTSASGGDYDLSMQRGGKVERLTVKIPAGIESGKSIRLAGQGEPGRNGGPNGDLLVTVNVAPHPYFRRDGNNVSVEVPVSVSEAILGAKVDVPTLSGEQVSVTLPAGTSSGAKLRLRGKGFRNPRTGTTGDQFVIIKITVPKDIDEQSRELIEQFAMLNPQFPRDDQW
ncbi:Curved DNA-binding protein [Thalassoglobus neptunius]|uniref:Curved DNA-binding protein n=1 Tax=Thalassoglobus neptunius TaxID=1938619 RepID=A0A5C5X3I0_9PLAN|nr:DnaJ C-terminal domain-containing protein [Thalassoglobus neptunius]TWT57358.1 Curved DNA-binding protein [Thalassoglobus neptunius]